MEKYHNTQNAAKLNADKRCQQSSFFLRINPTEIMNTLSSEQEKQLLDGSLIKHLLNTDDGSRIQGVERLLFRYVRHVNKDCYYQLPDRCAYCETTPQHLLQFKIGNSTRCICLQCVCVWIEHESGVKLIEHKKIL
jgi:hypothetical protein